MAQFETQKINDISIRPVIVNDSLNNPDTVVGYDYFPQVYSNTFIIAKKRSGKSTLIYNILKHCSGKDTRVLFFVSTIFKDSTYKKILSMLDKKGIEYLTHDSFIDDESGEDLLKGLLEDLKQPDEVEEDIKKPVKPRLIDFGDYEEKKALLKEQKKIKKKKKVAPEIILCIDDMGLKARSKSLTQLLKINRHQKMKVLISSQDIHDIEPSAIKNLDYCIIAKSLNNSKILKIYQDLDLGNIDIQKFTEVYKFATEKPYSFLYIDVREEKYRIGFNTEIKV